MWHRCPSTAAVLCRACRKLANEGLLTLGQVLDCYPSRLITSQPGRLPEVDDVDPVVTLAVRLMRKPVSTAAAVAVVVVVAGGKQGTTALLTCWGFARRTALLEPRVHELVCPPCPTATAAPSRRGSR